jgi:hypothetical protein
MASSETSVHTKNSTKPSRSPLHPTMDLEMAATSIGNVGNDYDYGISEEQLNLLGHEEILDRVRPEYNEDGLINKRFLVTKMAITEAQAELQKKEQLVIGGGSNLASVSAQAGQLEKVKAVIPHPSKTASLYSTQINRILDIDKQCHDLNTRDILRQDAIKFLSGLGYEVMHSFETCGLVNLPVCDQTHIGSGICILTSRKSEHDVTTRYALHFYHFHRRAVLQSELSFRFDKMTAFCCGSSIGPANESFVEDTKDSNSRLIDAIYGSIDITDVLACTNFSRVTTEVTTTAHGQTAVEMKQAPPPTCCACCKDMNCCPKCNCCTIEGVNEFSALAFSARHEIDLNALIQEKMVRTEEDIWYKSSNRFIAKEVDVKGDIETARHQKSYKGLEITYIDQSSGQRCRGISLIPVFSDGTDALKITALLQSLIHNDGRGNGLVVLPDGTHEQAYPWSKRDPFKVLGLDRESMAKPQVFDMILKASQSFTSLKDIYRSCVYLQLLCVVIAFILAIVGLAAISDDSKYAVNLLPFFGSLGIMYRRVRWILAGMKNTNKRQTFYHDIYLGITSFIAAIICFAVGDELSDSATTIGTGVMLLFISILYFVQAYDLSSDLGKESDV